MGCKTRGNKGFRGLQWWGAVPETLRSPHSRPALPVPGAGGVAPPGGGGRGPVAAAGGGAGGAGEGGTPGRNRAPPGCGVTAGLRRPRTAPDGTGRRRQRERPRGTGTGRHQDRPRERPRSRCRRAAADLVPDSSERGHQARPRDGARGPRERLAPGRDPAGGRGRLDGGWGRRLPVVRGQKRVMAPWLRLRVLHLLLRHVPAAVLLPRPSAPAHRAPAAPLPCLQPQDHRGHRLSRGAFHRHRHHHRLLLHVLLLLPVPAPAALPHTPARPGNSPVQLPPRSSPSSLPRGPQSRPYTSPAWLHPHGHVPPARPCRPVPHVPLRAPCLQPHSTATLRPGAAQLPWSMSPRGDPRTRRRPAGPGWGPQGPPLAPGGCLSQRWIGLFPAILR